MIHIILAQEAPSVPWPITSNWMFGFIGFLGIVFLVLAVINQAKKLFARRPPVDDELANMRKEIAAVRAKGDSGRKGLYTSLDEHRVDTAEKFAELQKEIGEKLDEKLAELGAQGQRRLETINQKFEEIAGALARLDERTKHLH